MTAHELAQQATQAQRHYAGTLSVGVCEKLALGHVAAWLYQQDDAVLPTAAVTACEAIRLIHAHYL